MSTYTAILIDHLPRFSLCIWVLLCWEHIYLQCLYFISLVLDPLAIRFSVSSGCARRGSVSTYAAILVLHFWVFLSLKYSPVH